MTEIEVLSVLNTIIMRKNDTIAAIATALSPSGIGIIRLSGEDSLSIADKVFTGRTKLSDVGTHTINYGYVTDNGQIVDQVLVMVMMSPRSYTGENVVEFQCHGGVLVMKKILSLLLDAGAYLAEPGEFTRRAFLNGKIDLSQAEAVCDIIEADNANALSAGIRQLRGKLSSEVHRLREYLLHEIAFIEAALDDPEHYSLVGYGSILDKKMAEIQKTLESLVANADIGLIIKSGINTVILGKPNVGKSSIYNLLAGYDKAIVTNIAGTTRDTLSENIEIAGVKLNIMDTAGLRESDDQVEKIGVLRAKSAASDADLLLCVIEIASEISPEDLKILDFTKEKRRIVILNKTDIFCGNSEYFLHEIQNIVGIDTKVILFSAMTGFGRDELETAISDMFFNGRIDLNNQIYVTSVRNLNCLKEALRAVRLVRRGISESAPEDLLSIDLQDAYDQLGQILGMSVDEDIINEIFSKFCMGK